MSDKIKKETHVEEHAKRSYWDEKDFELIVETSFDGLLVSDGDGNVLFVNNSYVQNTGIQKEEIIGHNIRELLNPVWMKESAILLALEKKKPISFYHITKNGNHVISTGTPIFKDGEIHRVVVNTRDISEIYALREELGKAKAMEKLYLEQAEAQRKDREDEIVVKNRKMQNIYATAEKIASFDTTVLITGDSGVGKELIARHLHIKNRFRNNKPFITINCGAVPENLLESELFGYEDGSFTGGIKGGKKGIIENCNGGTLFLDEIGEMSLNLQVKLLRVLENRTITRLGSSQEIPVDVRVIAATNRSLDTMVKEKSFRADLYYRLNVITIKVPNLKERIDEIAPLALNFLKKFNRQYGQQKKLSFEVVKELELHTWKGNVRELRNTLENMVVLSNNEYLQLDDIPWMKAEIKEESEQGRGLNQMLEEYERQILINAKEKYGTSRKIAAVLKLDQSTVVRKMNKYGIK
ncbi:sigma-54 interaction domain-containing protein [Zhenpiania hominis]|uniref:sigma-54 interaction domain-containing protein n=1 Tax=Zhenpiania hominis TaxID=2763644 RepID=UPI0039F5387B